MSEEKVYESNSFWSGVGLYYIFLWVFTFYPAFIISICLRRLFWGMEEDAGAYVFGIVVMIILTFIIMILGKLKQYVIVLMLYLLTAWPFLYILKHCCEHAGENDTYPLPLDWCPFW